MSYFGALTRFGEINCKEDLDDNKVYFDPGNKFYKHCFQALFGKDNNWNQETLGDIIESLLGIDYRVKHGLMKPIECFPYSFVKFLHDFCLTAYIATEAYAWRVSTHDILRHIATPGNADKIDIAKKDANEPTNSRSGSPVHGHGKDHAARRASGHGQDHTAPAQSASGHSGGHGQDQAASGQAKDHAAPARSARGNS